MKIILNLNLRLTIKKREKLFDGHSLFSLIIWYKYGSGKIIITAFKINK